MNDRELLQQALYALLNYPLTEGQAIEAIRTRLAQPESEEWKVWTIHNHIFFSIGVQSFQINDVLEHQPEVLAEEFSEWLATQLRHALTQLSNTAQPKKEWVGLTDREIDDLDYSGTRVEFARDIEAKLKEKNNG
jgi:hypothetical protein